MYHDLTLRDGSHAISHKLSEQMIIDHCIFAEEAGIEVIEIGHGNGLGASSILIGESLLTDYEMISIAKKYLKNTKLSVHIIPGIATINHDILKAIELGVDIFRVASHCTEASLTKTHIEYLSKITPENIEQAVSEEHAGIYRTLNDFSLLLLIIKDNIKVYVLEKIYNRQS